MADAEPSEPEPGPAAPLPAPASSPVAAPSVATPAKADLRLWEVDLDWRSVVWAMVAFVGLIALTGLVRSAPRAITVLAIGGLLALALARPVSSLQRVLGGRRGAAVAAIMMGSLVVVSTLIALLAPPAIDQGRQLGSDIDNVVGQIEDLPFFGDDLAEAGAAEKVRDWINELPERLKGDDTPIGKAALQLADSILVALITILVTITLLLDGPRLVRGARRLFRPERRAQADRVARLVYGTVGRYAAGSMLVAVIAGTVTLVVSLLLGIPLAPLIAVWVAVFDLVPQIGGAAGGIPFVLLGLTQGIGTGLICAVFFILYLQFENHILGPFIVGRAVKLSPPATMIAALVGVSVGGVVGALLAVPVVAAAKVTYLELRRETPNWAEQKQKGS